MRVKDIVAAGTAAGTAAGALGGVVVHYDGDKDMKIEEAEISRSS